MTEQENNSLREHYLSKFFNLNLLFLYIYLRDTHMYSISFKGNKMEKTGSVFSAFIAGITCLLWRAAVAIIGLECSYRVFMLCCNLKMHSISDISNECVLASTLISRYTALICVCADAHGLWKAESNFLLSLKFPKLFSVLQSVFLL